MAHRYFRLLCTNWAGSYVRITELQLFVGATKYPTSNMTSNTAPSPLVASVSSELGAGFTAWYAFDSSTADASRWINAHPVVEPEYIQIDLGSGNDIAPDSMKIAPDSTGAHLVDFEMVGSTTGAFAGEEESYGAWTGVNTGWSANTLRTFTLTPPGGASGNPWYHNAQQ